MTGNTYETMIGVSKKTRQRLRELGTKGETYDQIVKRVLDHYEKYKDNSNL